MSELKENLNEAKSYFLQDLITTGYCFKVIDGDTIKCVIKFKDDYLKVTVRLDGIDTAEKKSKTQKAIDATNFTTRLLFDKNIKLVFKKLDKYGRHLCDVYNITGGQTISQQLLDANLALEYHGGKKEQMLQV